MMVKVPSVEELSKYKLKELKDHCKSNDLPVTGTKAELVERLHSYLLQQAEEMLLDDDDDENDSVVPESGVALSTQLAPPITITAKIAPSLSLSNKPVIVAASSGDAAASEAAPAKMAKITMAPAVAAAVASAAPPSSSSNGVTAAVKDAPVARDISSVDARLARSERFGTTDPETAKMKRALRFGGAVASASAAPAIEDAKRKRAERFGLSVESSASSNGNKSTEGDAERIKKRAERFGVQVSASLKEQKSSEVLKARQARFGDQLKPIKSGAALSIPGKGASAAEDEAKKKRQERFAEKAPTTAAGDVLKSRAERFGVITA